MTESAATLPAIADRFKSKIISETAMRLTATHGRRKMYSAEQVAAAMAAAQFPDAWRAWAVAVFCTNAEFDDFCAKNDIAANYQATRDDVLRFVDKSTPSANARIATGAGVAGATGAAIALGTGAALANTGSSEEDQRNKPTALDVVDVATAVDPTDVVSGLLDVIGGIFD